MEAPVSVLAAVDLSEISAAVVETGRRLARRLGGRCHVVHVMAGPSGEEEAALLLPALRRWVRRERREASEALAALIRGTGDPELSFEVAEGRTADRIVERAQELGARLVAVGGPPPTLTLGHTAERVVRRNPVATLVIRRPPREGYRNAVVGVDFSDCAALGVRVGLDLLEAEGRLTACHVLDTLGLPLSGAVRAAAAAMEARLGEWVGARAEGHPVAVRVEVGPPGKVLVEAAREVGADLLVVGSRGHSRWRAVLLGSVAEAAARRAPCDVLVGGLGDGEGLW